MMSRPHPLPILAAAAAGLMAGGYVDYWQAEAAPGAVASTVGVGLIAVTAAAGACLLAFGLLGLAARMLLGPQECPHD